MNEIRFKDSLLFCGCLFSKSAPRLSHSSLRSALEMCKTMSIPTKRTKIHFVFIILLNGSWRFSNVLIVACYSSTLRMALNWEHNWSTHTVLPTFILLCFHWSRLVICIYKQSFLQKCKNRYGFWALSGSVVDRWLIAGWVDSEFADLSNGLGKACKVLARWKILFE